MLTGLALGLPGPVTSLDATSNGSDWIYWGWTNPVDADFNQTQIYIDGSLVATLDNTTTFYNATGLSESTSYQISTITTNFTGISAPASWANDTASTAAAGDTTGPAAVTALSESSTGSDWINWTWTNPGDSDFNQSVISIDSVEVVTLDNTTTSYNATGLSSGSHTISILTKDLTGNDGGTASDSADTDSGDTTGPAAVTALGESSVGSDWIYWEWTNPIDSDFNQSVISIDSVEVATLDNTTAFYNATGLSSGSHTISILTRDLTGNDGGTASDSADISSGPDTTVPGSISSLEVEDKGSDWIKWSWDNPSDSDFDYSMIYLDDVFMENVTTEYYTTPSNLSASTSYTIKVHTVDDSGNINTTDVTNTTSTYSQNYITGDRIWDENADQSEDYYIWDAKSFSGFFYDLESGLSSENMTIRNIDRSIDDGDIIYQTKPVDTDFDHSGWGSYQVIGFMAEKYFAAYTADTDIDVEEVSMMSSGQLSKILIDDDDKESVFAGSSLTLEDGYDLNIAEVDVNGNSVLVTLTKDGDELDTGIVESNDDYIYETDIGDADDVAIIIVHFDDVFSGTESNAVFIEGIFQISDEYLELDDGSNFGEMEITSISDELIEMENEDGVSLSKGDSIELMGKINLIVADNNDLRFAPYVDMTDPGTYELRGTVAEATELLTWTPLNFEGFYYDIDEGIQTETLELKDISGRKIAYHDLEYNSVAKSVEFEHSEWGEFEVIGFVAQKYFVGFDDDNTTIDGVDDVSLLSSGYLSEVLTDDDEKVSVFSGSSLQLEEGYSLDIVEVDTNGDRVLVELYLDGDEVDTGIASSGSDYVYETDLGDADDVPLIIVHFDEVFRGTESNAVFVQGIFQISDDYVELESGDNYDEMEITSFDDDSITMKNDDSISLSRDDDIELMGNVGIKVADSDTVRYYPYVERVVAASETLSIDLSSETVVEDEEVIITVTSRGGSVGESTVKVDGTTIGTTEDDGTLAYTFSTAGTFEITAEKDNYATGSKDIEIIDEDDETKKMSIEVSPDEVYEGTSMTIFVLQAIGGEGIDGAKVSLDGKSIGTTGSDGTVTYTATETGTHKITATKSGLIEAELDVKVQEQAAKFVYSNLEISPLEIKQGQEATISANIVNSGTANGSFNVELKINDVVVDSQLVSLDIDQSTVIEFTHEEEEIGTYKAQIGDLSKEYEVFEKSGVVLYILGAVALAAIGGVGYLFTAGGWTVEIAQAKVSEAVEALKELVGNLR